MTQASGPSPFRFPVVRPDIPEPADWLPYLRDSYDRRWFANFGPAATRFEAALAAQFGEAGDAIVAASSATSALAACLIAEGVTGRVLVPAFTFPASVSAIRMAGAAPALVDVDPASWACDLASLERGLDRTGAAAVMLVAPFGITLDFTSTSRCARRAACPSSSTMRRGSAEAGGRGGRCAAAPTRSIRCTRQSPSRSAKAVRSRRRGTASRRCGRRSISACHGPPSGAAPNVDQRQDAGNLRRGRAGRAGRLPRYARRAASAGAALCRADRAVQCGRHDPPPPRRCAVAGLSVPDAERPRGRGSRRCRRPSGDRGAAVLPAGAVAMGRDRASPIPARWQRTLARERMVCLPIYSRGGKGGDRRDARDRRGRIRDRAGGISRGRDAPMSARRRLFQHPCRVADDGDAGRHILGHYRAHADDGATTDHQRFFRACPAGASRRCRYRRRLR